jgi:hypothetical protein
MRKSLGVLVLMICTVSSVQAWEEPDGFHGILWSASRDDVKGSFPWFTCLPTIESCSGELTIGTVRGKVLFLFGPQGMDGVSITFASSQYSTIMDAFVARYGPPASRSLDPVRTLAGASFTNETLGWSGTNTIIVLEKYAGKVTESFAHIRHYRG